MTIQISLVAEDDLLAFAAGRVGVDGVEIAAAVGLGDVGVSGRTNPIIVCNIDGCDVDRVGDILAPVGGEVDFPSGYVVCSLGKKTPMSANLSFYTLEWIEGLTASWKASQGKVVTSSSVALLPMISVAKLWS